MSCLALIAPPAPPLLLVLTPDDDVGPEAEGPSKAARGSVADCFGGLIDPLPLPEP